MTNLGERLLAVPLRRYVAGAVVIAVIAVIAVITLSRHPAHRPEARPTTPHASTSPSHAVDGKSVRRRVSRAQQPAAGIFGPTSVWRQSVRHAPIYGRSGPMVRNLESQVHDFYGVASFNAFQYNVTWYSVGRRQPVTTVKFSNCQHKPYVPHALYGPGGQFVNVPIPAAATPSNGTDATLSIYRKSTDQLWELWQAYRDQRGLWHACWGGRMDHVSKSLGYFEHGFGAAATGLAGEGGDVTIADVRRGTIDHALSLAIPRPAIWTRVAWPAQRSDGGNKDPSAIPEGTRLRLAPGVNIARLHLTPIARMIAVAAKKYGFIVTNASGAVTVTAESGRPTKAITGVNPWKQLLDGVPAYSLLKGFPWSRLQVIAPNYHRPASDG